jgi:uncharacterized Tic20 family protein
MLTGPNPVEYLWRKIMHTLTREERNWAMLSHLSALTGYFFAPIVGNIVAPLIIYLMKKDESPFVADQARESLNFQISMSIYWLISGVLVLILIGFLLLAAIWVVGVVLTVIASVKAANGEAYRYPLTIRLIS